LIADFHETDLFAEKKLTVAYTLEKTPLL